MFLIRDSNILESFRVCFSWVPTSRSSVKIITGKHFMCTLSFFFVLFCFLSFSYVNLFHFSLCSIELYKVLSCTKQAETPVLWTFESCCSCQQHCGLSLTLFSDCRLEPWHHRLAKEHMKLCDWTHFSCMSPDEFNRRLEVCVWKDVGRNWSRNRGSGNVCQKLGCMKSLIKAQVSISTASAS